MFGDAYIHTYIHIILSWLPVCSLVVGVLYVYYNIGIWINNSSPGY